MAHVFAPREHEKNQPNILSKFYGEAKIVVLEEGTTIPIISNGLGFL